MDITGTIIAVLPAQSGVSQRTGNTWMRQEYVIEVSGQYPKKMCFTLFGEDRIKQFDIHQGEQNITVQFDIDAHEYNGKWFNEIRAYNVLRPYNQGGQQTYAPQQAQPTPACPPFPPIQNGESPAQDKNDDLPF